MNEYRIYRYIAYKTRRVKKSGGDFPWALRTLRHLGIPLNRVKELDSVNGVGGTGICLVRKHARSYNLRYAKFSTHLSDWWCLFQRGGGQYKCSGVRGRRLRDGCNKPHVRRVYKRRPPPGKKRDSQ